MTQLSRRSTPAHIFRAVWGKLWWLFGLVIIGSFFLLGVLNPVLLAKLLSLLFIIISVVTMIYAERSRRQQHQSRTWTPVQGRVLSSEVEKEIHRSGSRQGGPLTWSGTTSYFPRVEYTYEYLGATYQSKGIITININWPKKEAEAAVARYPADASVTVWVNPETPHHAVLEPGIGRYGKKYKMAFFIAAAFMIIGSLGWFFAPLLRR